MLEIDYATFTLAPHVASLDGLSADEQARAARLVDERGRARFLDARRTLRFELARRLGVRPDAIAFAYGPHGKPSLAPAYRASGITFSLSHSGGLALLAIARWAEIGVDLEEIRPVRYPAAIARRLFAESEGVHLRSLTGEVLQEPFFRLWTRHEALVKCRGGSVLGPALASCEAGFTFATVPVPSGFVATICAAAPALHLTNRPLYSAG